VQPFPPTGGRFQVSKGGGRQPKWRSDGKELFFLAIDGTMMATAVDTSHDFQAGAPQGPFATSALRSGDTLGSQYDVARGGQRFLVITPRAPDRNASLPVTIVVNWLDSVHR